MPMAPWNLLMVTWMPLHCMTCLHMSSVMSGKLSNIPLFHNPFDVLGKGNCKINKKNKNSKRQSYNITIPDYELYKNQILTLTSIIEQYENMKNISQNCCNPTNCIFKN